MKEQRIVTPDNLDPDVFTVKTVDSKNYITVNVRGEGVGNSIRTRN